MKTKTVAVAACMVTGCQRSARSRGLCEIHYTALAMKVKSGKFTWEQLIEAGVCLDSKRSGKNGIGLSQFLKDKGIT